jgi:hypothetical protein
MTTSLGKLDGALQFLRILSNKELDVQDSLNVKNNLFKAEYLLKGFYEVIKELVTKHGGQIIQGVSDLNFKTDEGKKAFYLEYTKACESTVDCPVFKEISLEALKGVKISAQGLMLLQEIGIIESGDVV